ncbi:MAG TPA: hypothetical protein DDX71_05855 [Ruminococcus sp.]|nr:hypothetical protein [Ruminococcus sp.]
MSIAEIFDMLKAFAPIFGMIGFVLLIMLVFYIGAKHGQRKLEKRIMAQAVPYQQTVHAKLLANNKYYVLGKYMYYLIFRLDNGERLMIFCTAHENSHGIYPTRLDSLGRRVRNRTGGMLTYQNGYFVGYVPDDVAEQQMM